MLQAIGGGGGGASYLTTVLCPVSVSVSVRCKVKPSPMGKGKSKGKTVKLVESEQQGIGKLKNAGFGEEKKKEQLWQCVKDCGACCKLAKGPTFATPEEIFDNPSDIQLYESLIGADGWCIHYDKSNRTCSIYDDRPYFCRVEPDVFQNLYGISKKKFNNEACSCCKDTIKAIYGADSEELDRFNKAIRS